MMKHNYEKRGYAKDVASIGKLDKIKVLGPKHISHTQTQPRYLYHMD